MHSALYKWLCLSVCSGTLLATNCIDSTQVQGAVASGIQLAIASVINALLQGVLSSALAT